MDLQISDYLQLIVGISILSVWLLHAHVPTNFRVGQAQTLREEVTEAGLPDYVYDVMRIVKPIFAFFLIMGILWNPITLPCMAFTTIFMVGAVVMHIKVKDNLFKMIPALTLLLFCFIIFTCPSKW
tara:strand:- start:20768 stop:21145 length:378 start_codon:yes stop_codon:yes gene_type:complete